MAFVAQADRIEAKGVDVVLSAGQVATPVEGCPVVGALKAPMLTIPDQSPVHVGAPATHREEALFEAHEVYVGVLEELDITDLVLLCWPGIDGADIGQNDLGRFG